MYTNADLKIFLKKLGFALCKALNSHYEAWSYKKKTHKKIKAYRKSVQEPTVKRCLLILGQMALSHLDHRSKDCTGREFYRAFSGQRIPESSCTRKKNKIGDINVLLASRNGDRKTMKPIRITSRPSSRIRKSNQLNQLR